MLTPLAVEWWRSSLALRVIALLVLVALLASGAPAPSYAASPPHILPQLEREAKQNPNKRFRVVIIRATKSHAADTELQKAGGSKVRDLAVNGFVAVVPGKKLKDLAESPHIKFIAYDPSMRSVSTVDPSQLATNYPATVRASELWSSFTGAGVGVAVIDTGIAANRADWNNNAGKSRIVAQARFNANTSSYGDGHGHGTHVAGIIAGNSWQSASPAVRGKYVGVAPNANLINVKVADDAGVTYISDVIDAIEWVIANRKAYNIRVMNLSLISSIAESHRTSLLDAAVERAWFNGILVVVAAGNNGADTMQYPPANDPFVVTVGAADALGTVATADDLLAPWSSYGMTQDAFAKPDVVAPGRYIVAPLAAGSVLGSQFSQRISDTTYVWMSGTSMAAPIVSGVGALAFQAHPEWTNDQIKWLLLHTSAALGPAGQLPGQGAGEVDAVALTRFGATPSLANQGQQISGLLLGPNGATTYVGQSSGKWSSANWSSANWTSANWSTTNWTAAPELYVE